MSRDLIRYEVAGEQASIYSYKINFKVGFIQIKKWNGKFWEELLFLTELQDKTCQFKIQDLMYMCQVRNKTA